MNDAIFMKDIPGFASDTTLFTTIQTLGDDIFEGMETSDLQVLAEEYYIHSSKKPLSALCRKWLTDAVDLQAFINKIASALLTRYGRNWARIWQAYFKTDYKPLDNYDMEEKETPDLIDTTDINTGTDLKNVSKSKVYGFNTASDSPVGDSENEVTTTGDKTKNETTSKTTRKGSRTLTRKGNIGVTTSMQMLTGEIDGRQYDFWENVFSDIDRLLCFMMWSM